MLNIRYEKTTAPKELPAADNPLKFGTIFTDHMFLMDYEEGKGWHDARIVPYGPISLEPSAMVFHYGQEMFEGLKAYKTEDGRTLLFRPNKNAERANNSNKRLCIPTIPEEDFVEAVKAVVKMDERWIPTKSGTSLYIRPFVIATDPFLGVRPSNRYLFAVILSPVGAYYPEGLNPVKIWIEDEYVRAIKGGIGEAKTGGNYVASLASQVKAHEEGYSQVLWLDGKERKYIEEVGAMNIFFKINGKVLTPALNGSILPGVTRDSVISLCKQWNLEIEERRISVEELYEAGKDGSLEEVFGTGTAAVISPVGHLRFEDHVLMVGDGGIGELSQKIYDTITGIQLGKIEDTLGWTVEVV
ncbi:MAG TPA: branched chain amino acid aminotransferase [Lachnoclostridium phytofermentans]|uniref:Branched-chain-amino-acid aminotransferase n=1 Tax=Lachnoclostridium phytofermentans TaxID=66219 RepID=A0A3D2X9G1_9FIRM|nr:branched-chain amino acid aminotransferase [Lachnoclostridium sp.]HCL03233.1 branched chain amino acid aminotransferase [Lachnoclostridium phytofermentans]